MDFSKTKVYQRTRSRYEKFYLEFNEKKKNRRIRNGGGGDLNKESDGDRVNARVGGVGSTGEGSGNSSEGLRGSDGRRDEINCRSRKIRKGHEGSEQLGRVSKRGKSVRGVCLVDESDDNDDDGAGLNESLQGNKSTFGIDDTSGSGKVQKNLQKGKSLKRGKNLSQNSLTDELEDDCGHDYDDDCVEPSKSSGGNHGKLDNHRVPGSGKTKKKFEKQNSDDVSLSHLGDNAKSSNLGRNDGESEYDNGSGNFEKKTEKGFVNNTTASNGNSLKRKRGLRDTPNKDTSENSRGCPIDVSEDEEGVAYLGNPVTCLDDYDPSHSSRVESNEVKVSPVELDSIRADDEDSQGLKSTEKDNDDLQKLESSKEDDGERWELEPSQNAAATTGCKDFEIISLSSSSEREDGDADSSVLEVENIGDAADRFWTEVVRKQPSDEEHEEINDYRKRKYFLKGKFVDESGKKNQKVNVMESGVSKLRCDIANDKANTINGGLKERWTDADTLLGCGKKAIQGGLNQPIVDEDYCKTDFLVKDNNDGDGAETFVQMKSTGRKHAKLGKEIDVIRILTDTIREEGDGDKLLRKYVTLTEDSPPEETHVEQALSYKFRFEDEDTEPATSESEMEIDGLFDEMNMCLQLSEIGSSGTHVVDCGDADLAEETDQATFCRQGKHHLTLNDQFGIICRCCPYVEIEIRDILPPLCKNGRGGHERHDMDKADNPKVSDLQWADCNHAHDSKRSKYEEGTVWDLVPGVKETLYPHQREGFEFIWTKIAGGTHIEKLEKRLPSGGSGCIISHAPGTGKSRLTIVFLQAFMRMYPTARPLIIAPRCMLLTWKEEFKKWNVDAPFYILNKNECSGQEDIVAATLLKQAGNTKSVRCLRLLKLYSWNKNPSVLGITYGLFESLAGDEGKRKRAVNNPEDEEIKRILLHVPTLLVLDEGHTPRNDQSLVWKALLNVKTKRNIILSGTPFQNSFDELYNTLCLVNPLLSFGISPIGIDSDALSTKKRGWKNISAKGQWDSITSSVRKNQHKVPELRAMIDPFVHLHKGTILQERLPGLRDALVVLKPTKTQQTLLAKIRGTKVTLENDHLMSLVSVHPSLLPETYSDIKGFHKMLKVFERDPRAGVKTNFLMELIKLSKSLNEKVLVFSQYLKPLEFIMELVKSNFKWVEGRECLYMDGQQEEKQRQASINTLNDPKSEVKVLLASLRACSEGISLVGASRVVLLDVHWNPSVERQAISRAYRLGQKKLVHVYHLVTGSMEGEKYIRQVEKSHLSELVFSSKNKDSSNPKISSTVSADKILEAMVQHDKLQDIFEKVIYQPKEADLINTFG